MKQVFRGLILVIIAMLALSIAVDQTSAWLRQRMR